jgi:DNA-binding transcriptional LysR family regulator
MRNIESYLAKVFVSIVEEGSIAKAAAREHIVPSAVSKRLAELEAMLNVTLVERGGSRIKLTPAGERMLYHARSILQAAERMRSEMSEYSGGVRGYITMRMSATSLSAGLLDDVSSFLIANKHIRVELEQKETLSLLSDLIEGNADLGVAPDIWSSEELQYIPYKNKTYEFAVVVQSSHPLAKLKKVSYLDTLKYDHVEYGRESGLSKFLDYAAGKSLSAKRVRIRVHGWDSVFRVIGCNMGIGIVPSSLKNPYGRLFDVKFVPLTDSWARRRLCVIARDFASLSTIGQALVQHLR